MSNTEKSHQRFWTAMIQRFGTRWGQTYGLEPTLAWRELLDRYTPGEVKLALELMHQRGFEHPPTEPQFAQLLNQAQTRGRSKQDDPIEARRGYWRSMIVTAVATQLGYDVVTFEPVLIENKHSLGAAMRKLLDQVDALEVTTGQRTSGQEAMVERQCREIVADFCLLAGHKLGHGAAAGRDSRPDFFDQNGEG